MSKRYVLGLIPILLIATACDPSLNVRIRPDTDEKPVLDFCKVYQPIYISDNDTEETLKQIDANNAVFLEKCSSN